MSDKTVSDHHSDDKYSDLSDRQPRTVSAAFRESPLKAEDREPKFLLCFSV